MTRLKFRDSLFHFTLLVIGAILGAVISTAINTGLSATLSTMTAVLIAQAVLLLYLQQRHDAECAALKDIATALDHITHRVGLEVYYQDSKTLIDSPTEIDRVAQVMSAADEEILVLDLNEPDQLRDDAHLPESVRIAYYDGLFKRLEEQRVRGKKFEYKRISQFVSDDMSFSDLGDPVYIQHCQQMVKASRLRDQRIYLKRTRLHLPTTFLIIDKKYLILHLTGVRNIDGQLKKYMRGELIIHDPQSELIDFFLRAWEDVENSPSTRTVSPSDMISSESSDTTSSQPETSSPIEGA